ncbi:hypothetical protein CXG81DRAFT_5846, partial [Caulochytrium protostelioides]
PSARAPLTGRLRVRLLGVLGLMNKRSHRSAVYATLRIDGAEKAQSRRTRGSWNEALTADVVRGHSVELVVCDGESQLPLGLVWFRLQDLRRELTLRGAESAGGLPPSSAASSATDLRVGSAPPRPGPPAAATEELWLDMEPAGQLHVQFAWTDRAAAFMPTGTAALAATALAPAPSRPIVRRRAVQKIMMRRGHRFAAIQFYRPMKCAVCHDFLFDGQGFQCQLCRYTCHRRCQARVVPKCITASEQEAAAAEAVLNHNIPHRFQPSANRNVNWCAHCGVMLPLVGAAGTGKSRERGRKDVQKCTECGLHAHGGCAVLIPNFCGLSPQMVAQLQSHVDAAERGRRDRQQQQQQQQRGPGHGRRSSQAPAAPPAATLAPGPPRPAGGLDDWTFLAVLGKGNFGKVMLAEEKATGGLFAIKVLKKAFIIENDEVESTRSEKRVFLAANRTRHPFLVNLHSCFQTESRLYFVMEYVAGGDLMWHIQQHPFSAQRATFYAAEVLLALEYFHENAIVYRDLKLDNILLAPDGHIKIADYGLCKENMGRSDLTHTLAGTADYMAPEILTDGGYGRAVDWWAFGVLVYQLLLGQSPFRGSHEDAIFDAILHDDVVYPPSLDREAVSLLQGLLVKNPRHRLGSGPDDAAPIRAHPFFRGIAWDALLARRVAPPYRPAVASPTDVSHFDPEFTAEPPVLTPCHAVLSLADQDEFRGFTYVADWA